MTDREDARVHPVQPAGGDAMADRRSTQAEIEQLAKSDDAVLAKRELRDEHVQRDAWFETLIRRSFRTTHPHATGRWRRLCAGTAPDCNESQANSRNARDARGGARRPVRGPPR
jgi:hypothetical protein